MLALSGTALAVPEDALGEKAFSQREGRDWRLDIRGFDSEHGLDAHSQERHCLGSPSKRLRSMQTEPAKRQRNGKLHVHAHFVRYKSTKEVQKCALYTIETRKAPIA